MSRTSLGRAAKSIVLALMLFSFPAFSFAAPTTTIHCDYAIPYVGIRAPSTPNTYTAQLITVSSTGPNVNLNNTQFDFQWASSTCIESVEGSTGGSATLTIDIDPLTTAIVLGFASLIFFLVFAWFYEYIHEQ